MTKGLPAVLNNYISYIQEEITIMAIIKNVELWYAKLDPKRPNSTFNKENPTWELQIRTRSKAQAKEWKEMNINVKPEEDDDGVYYKTNLKKKSMKRDGEPQNPVKVVSGTLDAIDPKIIGNGSIGNVRIFQYDYEVGSRKGVASMLMDVQITTLNEFRPKPREDDFEMVEMKVNKIADNQDVDDEIPFNGDDDIDF